MAQNASLAEILERFNSLGADGQAMLRRHAINATAQMLWVPNPGPQTEGYDTEADELFFGGQAGPGKTDLILGLATTRHRRALILRRTNKEAEGLVDRLAEVVGSRDGYNGQHNIWRLPGRSIDIGGCQLETDKQKYKGKPHDLIGFDEISDFSYSQYKFITTWNRSTVPNQRCRVVCAGNPPTRPEGLWVVQHWAAWLDPRHPNPALPGELRWYTTGEDGREIEVDGLGPWMIGGKPVKARSRTFIPGELGDNPDLASTNYDSVLAALPEELRRAYRDGRFDEALKDSPFQMIPTSWIKAAQERWIETPPPGIPMTAIGVDVAGGGEADNCISIRYDGWFANLEFIPGKMLPAGGDISGLIITRRRNGAVIVIDMGGGYGGIAYKTLKDNDIEVVAYKGSEGSVKRTVDGQMGFTSKRAESYWRFREALDPGQVGGSPIMLPDDPRLVADLTAPRFEIRSNRIWITPKDVLEEELQRSLDAGDAVVMAWSAGPRLITAGILWGQDGTEHGVSSGRGKRIQHKVVLSHNANRKLTKRGNA